jgi:predicted TIM-barrel fold metal-dependent hydrolase
MIVDTHTHVYSYDDWQYPPIENALRPADGAGAYSVLERQAREHGVSAACLVQPSTCYRWDNRFVCDTARANRQFAVGICTPNPDDADSPRLVEELGRTIEIRGVRSIPAANGHIDDPGVRAVWSAAHRASLILGNHPKPAIHNHLKTGQR